MIKTRSKVELTLHGDQNSPRFREAMAVLDGSGLCFCVDHEPGDVESGSPQVTWGKEVLSDFSKPQLVHFLWEHGAKFEDS